MPALQLTVSGGQHINEIRIPPRSEWAEVFRHLFGEFQELKMSYVYLRFGPFHEDRLLKLFDIGRDG